MLLNSPREFGGDDTRSESCTGWRRRMECVFVCLCWPSSAWRAAENVTKLQVEGKCHRIWRKVKEEFCDSFGGFCFYYYSCDYGSIKALWSRQTFPLRKVDINKALLYQATVVHCFLFLSAVCFPIRGKIGTQHINPLSAFLFFSSFSFFQRVRYFCVVTDKLDY